MKEIGLKVLYLKGELDRRFERHDLWEATSRDDDSLIYYITRIRMGDQGKGDGSH